MSIRKISAVPSATTTETTALEDRTWLSILLKRLDRFQDSKIYDYFTLFIVVLNAIFLGFYTNVQTPEFDTVKGVYRYTRPAFMSVVDTSEWVFVGFWVAHLLLRLITKGLRKSLQDYWFIFEALMTLLSLLSFIPGVANFTSIRLLVAIRYFARIPWFKQIDTILMAMGQALPVLRDIFLLFFFFLLFFGILGINLFGGSFGHRCVYTDRPEELFTSYWWDANDTETVCSIHSKYGFQCPQKTRNASGGLEDVSLTCMKTGSNPAEGTMSFDNILNAWLTLFQVVSTEGWSNVMFAGMNAEGTAAFLYFITVVVLGLYIQMQLIVGVVTSKLCNVFTEANKLERSASRNQSLRMLKEQQRREQGQTEGGGGTENSAETLQQQEKGKEETTGGSGGPSGLIGHVKIAPITTATDAIPVVHSTNSGGGDVTIAVGKVSVSQPSGIVPAPTPLTTLQRRVKAFWAKLRDWSKKVVDHSLFSFITQVMILANIIVMAMPYFQMPDGFRSGLTTANEVFMWFFVVELIFRIMADGLFAFFKSLSNLFDFAIVILGILDIYILPDGTGLTSLRALRASRALRVLKLGKHSKPLVRLMSVLRNSFPLVRSFATIWCTFGIVCALVGLQAFSGAMGCEPPRPDCEQRSRANFDYFGWALLTVFQLFTVENWNDVEVSVTKAKGIGATVYCIIVVVLGAYILSQMLLAIIVSGFQEILNQEIENINVDFKKETIFNRFTTVLETVRRKSADMGKSFSNSLEGSLTLTGRNKSPKLNGGTPGGPTVSPIQAPAPEVTNSPEPKQIPLNPMTVTVSPQNNLGDPNLPIPSPPLAPLALDPIRRTSFHPSVLENSGEASGSGTSYTSRSRSYSVHSDIFPESSWNQSVIVEKGGFWKTRSFFVFSPDNPFRLLVHRVVIHKFFDIGVVLLVIGSSITLAFETPTLAHDSREFRTLRAFDIVWATLFTIELLLRFIDRGVLFSDHAYLRSGWGVVDLFCTVVSIVGATPAGDNVQAIRAIRIARIGRLAKMHDGLRIVLVAMVRTTPAMLTVLVPYIFFLITFGIIGLSMFEGRLYQWDDVKNVTYASNCNPSFINGTNQLVMVDRAWRPYRLYYDNFYRSLLSVIVISLQEGWPDDMYRLMDIVDQYREPITNYSMSYATFSVVTVFIGNWFFVSVLQGVIIDNLKRNKDEVQGFNLLTIRQRAWMDWVVAILMARPKLTPVEPTQWFRKRCYHIGTHPYFSRVMVGIVVFNTFVMATNHADPSQGYSYWQHSMEIIFTLIYIAEFIILVAGQGWKVYRSSNWNLLSLAIIIFALIAIGLAAFDKGPGIPLQADVFFTLRVVVIFRLTRMFPGVLALARTMMLTFSQLLNVLFLMFLMYYAFAIIGMVYFGKINRDAVTSLNEHVGFWDFPTSLMTVYVMSTGENWPGIMHDLMMQDCPDCKESDGNCGRAWAPIFCLCIQFFISLTLLNTFIAIVVDTFNDMMEKESEMDLREECLDSFATLWAEFDPNYTWWLTYKELLALVEKIPGDLIFKSDAFQGQTTRPTARYFMRDVLLHEDKVYFSDALRAFFAALMGSSEALLPAGLERRLQKSHEKRNFSMFGSVEAERVCERAAIRIQREFRKRWYRRKSMINTSVTSPAMAMGPSPGTTHEPVPMLIASISDASPKRS